MNTGTASGTGRFWAAIGADNAALTDIVTATMHNRVICPQFVRLPGPNDRWNMRIAGSPRMVEAGFSAVRFGEPQDKIGCCRAREILATARDGRQDQNQEAKSSHSLPLKVTNQTCTG